MKISDLREEFIMDQDWSKDTVTWARRMLVILEEYLTDEGIELGEMTSGQFTRLLSALRQEGRSWSGRNGLYTVVGAFYRWLYQNGHIAVNIFANSDTRPKRPRKERKVVRTVSLSYVEALLRAASREDSRVNRRDKAIVSLIISTGMRRGEVVGITLPNVDFDRNEILLTNTKYNHERYVFLSSEVAETLKAWLAVRPSNLDHDAVFIALHATRRGLYHPLSANAVNKIFDRLKRDAGIPLDVSLTPHMLRHTFASEVAKSGNPFALMELLGHANIETTEIYVHTDKEELRRVSKHAPKFGQNGADSEELDH